MNTTTTKRTKAPPPTNTQIHVRERFSSPITGDSVAPDKSRRVANLTKIRMWRFSRREAKDPYFGRDEIKPVCKKTSESRTLATITPRSPRDSIFSALLSGIQQACRRDLERL